jgi:hypothetical protein
MLRRLLVGSAHYVLGPFGSDSDLRRHGQKMASRGGKNSKKRAVVAVARKLSRCSCTACGRPGRSTNRSTTRIGANRKRRLEQRRWSTQTSKEEVKIPLQRLGDPKVADGHG